MSRPTPLRSTLIALLTAPGGALEDWRDRVCRALRAWVGSDAAFFRLSDGSPSRLDPLDDLLRYRDAYRSGGFRRMDPWVTRRAARGGVAVGTFPELFGSRWRRRSTFVREFIEPQGIHDYIGLQVDTPDGDFVTLGLFNLRASRGPDFAREEAARLRAIVPALRVGIAAWSAHRRAAGATPVAVDETTTAALLLDDQGRVVHANSALARLLGPDPAQDRVTAEARALARDLARAATGDVYALLGLARERIVRTRAGLYRIRPSLDPALLRGDACGYVLLTLERSRA